MSKAICILLSYHGKMRKVKHLLSSCIKHNKSKVMIRALLYISG